MKSYLFSIIIFLQSIFAQAQAQSPFDIWAETSGINKVFFDEGDNVVNPYHWLTTRYFDTLDARGIYYTTELKIKYDTYLFRRVDTALGNNADSRTCEIFPLFPDSSLGLADTTRVKVGLMGRYTALPINALTWTLGQGVASNGASVLNTTINPTTDSTVLKRNSVSFGFYSRTDVANNNYFQGTNNLIPDIFIVPRHGSGSCYVRLNNGSTGQLILPVANSLGWYTAVRSDSLKLYKGGLWIGSTTTASSGKTNGEIYLCGVNNSGSPGFYDQRQILFAMYFNGLTYQEQQSINTIIEEFMDLENAGVQ